MSGSNNTYRQLLALLLIFVIGVFSIVGVNYIFSDLLNDLEKQTVNHKAKITIGEFLSEDIQQLRSLFFELATTSSNKRMIKTLDDEINKIVKSIETTLDVLENGGTLKRVIRLNIVNQHSIEREITYKKEDDEQLVLEVIDIKPKIQEFFVLKQKLIELIDRRQDAIINDNLNDFSDSVRDLQLFHRSVPAFFVRFAENNSRLLYEGELKLMKLQEEIDSKKESYVLIEITLVALILSLVLWLGYTISRSINRTNKELIDLNNKLNNNLQELENQKLFVRGILDAQSNIVLVTSGTKILDANLAMFNFLDEFKNLEEFLKEHECICDFFIPFGDDSRYVLQKDYNGDNWAEYVFHNPHLDHRVAIQKGGRTYHFKLNVDRQTFVNDEHILVVALNDITIEVETQKSLQILNENLENIVKEKTKELQDLNENLKQKVIVEVEKNRKKDQQMIQQSRYAALGEMIGNIAHQWRQPLSAISTTSSGMKLQLELGVAGNEDVQKAFDDIMYYVKFLTQTIEDFRGFFRKDEKKEPFNLIDSLNSTLKIISAAYKDNSIRVMTDFKSNAFIVQGSQSELSQVFLNILNNAKDILVEKAVEDKKIHIFIEEVDNDVVVYIQDNGGGIPDEIIEKVFDPYFTTKHKSQGTGIGLYMSKEIVEKKLNGFLTVKNREINIDNEHFEGACFVISIPLDKYESSES
ncbi:MAG: ATP-binding protein [Arcobacteraceae bacterium]